MDYAKLPLPNVRLRRLAAELVALRLAAKMSVQDVVDRTAIHRTTIEKIEDAKSHPQPRNLLALLDLYGVTDQKRREDLLKLAKPSRERAWFQPFTDALPGDYSGYISFESEASHVRRYEALVVPGLLQTRAYAQVVISEGHPDVTPEEIEKRVAVRLQRQAVLAGPDPLQLHAVLGEAAIRQVVGGRAVMVEQLQVLRATLDRSNVEVRVIPFDVGGNAGVAGSFTVMQFRDPEVAPLVYVDSMAGDLFQDDPNPYQRYLTTFERLQSLALDPEASARLIADAAKRIK